MTARILLRGSACRVEGCEYALSASPQAAATRGGPRWRGDVGQDWHQLGVVAGLTRGERSRKADRSRRPLAPGVPPGRVISQLGSPNRVVRSPPKGAGRACSVLVSASDRGIHRNDPLKLTMGARQALQVGQHPVQGAVLGPPVKTPLHRLSRRKSRRQIPPRKTGGVRAGDLLNRVFTAHSGGRLRHAMRLGSGTRSFDHMRR